MSYLNWKQEQMRVERAPHPVHETQLRLGLSPAQRQCLGEELRSVADRASQELRVDLPEGWTLFCKLRDEGESRLLLAHPDPERWVATLALNEEHLRRSIEGLAGKEPFSLSLLGATCGRSNFELQVAEAQPG